MKENQHTELKESWHDEYTRYISYEEILRKLIKKLKEHGWIERIGVKKNGYWKIIEKS